MKGVTWSSTVVAIVLMVVVMLVLTIFVFRTSPTLSKIADSILLGVKKPICCNLFGWARLSMAFCWDVPC
jgi:hypothetical protein